MSKLKKIRRREKRRREKKWPQEGSVHDGYATYVVIVINEFIFIVQI